MISILNCCRIGFIGSILNCCQIGFMVIIPVDHSNPTSLPLRLRQKPTSKTWGPDKGKIDIIFLINAGLSNAPQVYPLSQIKSWMRMVLLIIDLALIIIRLRSEGWSVWLSWVLWIDRWEEERIRTTHLTFLPIQALPTTPVRLSPPPSMHWMDSSSWPSTTPLPWHIIPTHSLPLL